MRSGWLCALLAGCGFTPGHLVDAGTAGDDDAADALVLPEGEHWIFDTAAELGGTGYSVDGTQIEARGVLTEVGYIYGGLLMYGKQSQQLWNTSSTTFDYAAT